MRRYLGSHNRFCQRFQFECLSQLSFCTVTGLCEAQPKTLYTLTRCCPGLNIPLLDATSSVINAILLPMLNVEIFRGKVLQAALEVGANLHKPVFIGV